MMTEKEQALRVAVKCIRESRGFRCGTVFMYREHEETGKYQKGISYEDAFEIILGMALKERDLREAKCEIPKYEQQTYNGDLAHDQMVDAARYE